MLLNQIGELVHEDATIRSRDALPGLMSQGGVCGFNGLVNVLDLCSLDGSNLFLGAVGNV